MVMAYIWTGMVLTAVLFSFWSGAGGVLSQAVLEASVKPEEGTKVSRRTGPELGQNFGLLPGLRRLPMEGGLEPAAHSQAEGQCLPGCQVLPPQKLQERFSGGGQLQEGLPIVFRLLGVPRLALRFQDPWPGLGENPAGGLGAGQAEAVFREDAVVLGEPSMMM